MKKWNDYLDVCEIIDPSSNIKSQFRELPKVSVVGCFQNGKSTFINCLLDEFIARPGDGLATTKVSTRYRWGKDTSVNLRSDNGDLKSISLSQYLNAKNFFNISQTSAFQVEITLPRNILEKVCLIDTPGFNADENDTENAIRSLEEANYAIIVLTNERTIGQPEQAMFKSIAEKNIPYAVIMNCRDCNPKTRWFPSHQKNQQILQENEAIIRERGYQPETINNDSLIYPCNFLWYWLSTDTYLNTKHLLPNNEYLNEDIEWVFAKKQITLSKENLRKESHFLPIKSFFENRLAHI